MNGHWAWVLAVVLACVAGALAASAAWWWLAPAPLLERWSAPLRRALEAGFDEQLLQQRLRAQADGVWARQQQDKWHERQETVQERHGAKLLADMRQVLKPYAAPVPRPLPMPRTPPLPPIPPCPPSPPLPPLPRRLVTRAPVPPAAVPAQAAGAETEAAATAGQGALHAAPVLAATLPDSELDALPPELPPPAARTRKPAGPGKLPLQSL